MMFKGLVGVSSGFYHDTSLLRRFHASCEGFVGFSGWLLNDLNHFLVVFWSSEVLLLVAGHISPSNLLSLEVLKKNEAADFKGLKWRLRKNHFMVST